MPLTQFLYISEIPGPRSFETVSSVVAESRPRNRELDISGLLVFDGEQVCQYLEGQPEKIDALVSRISTDPRHRGMQVLHHESVDEPRRFEHWRLGFLNLDGGRDLSDFRHLSGPQALQALFDLVPAIDIGP